MEVSAVFPYFYVIVFCFFFLFLSIDILSHCTICLFINKWNPRQEFRPQIRDSRWFSNRLMVKVLENRVLKRGGFRAEKGGKSGVKA